MVNNGNHQPQPQPHRIHFASCNDQDLENKLWPVIESRNPTAFVWAGDSIYADIETSSSKYTNNDNEYLSMSSTLSVLPTLSGTGDVICSTPHRLRALYQNQRNVVGYQNAILNNPNNNNITVFGTYDDHDYGCNNADKTYEHKHESGLAFMDFIEGKVASTSDGDTPSKTPTSIEEEVVVVPAPVLAGTSTSNSDGSKQEQEESAMRQRVRAGYGVYGVKLFDFDRQYGQYEVPEQEAMIDPDIIVSGHPSSLPLQSLPSSYSNMTVAVFVLDVRTNKDPWKTGIDSYKPDYDGDFLGERQWKWFESAIQNSNASVNIIVNGLQVHANIFPDSNIAESWDKFPRSRQRLYDTILQPGVHSPILISGDVHMTQFHRKDCVPNPNKNSGNGNYDYRPRPLIEMTTSGMTHSWGTLPSPPLFSNSDYKPSWSIWYEYIIKSNLMIFLHCVCPWKFLMDSSSEQEEIESHTNNGDDQGHDDRRLYPNGGGENSKSGLQYSLEKNFGEIEFDFDLRHVTLRSIGEDFDSHSNKPPLLMAKISMDQLDGQSYMPGGNHLSNEDFRIEAAAMAAALASERGGRQEGDWICIDHRGRENKLYNIMSYVTTGILLKNRLNFQMITLIVALFYIVRRLCNKNKSNNNNKSSSSSLLLFPTPPKII